jgi:exopolyphosphatase/guanosine-5'-triphosphate,3'-diphosphate pyrophosphatase
VAQSVRTAVIDVGSNSVRLLVADVLPGGALNPLLKRLNTTRVAQGMGRTGCLSEKAMERTIDAIAEYQRIARDMGAAQLYAFATAAVREARNRDEFILAVHRHTRLLVNVLSEKEEAEAGFAGADIGGPYGIIDIGGGSTELAVGQARIPRASVSMKIGAVRLTERYPLGDVADPLGMEAMIQTVRGVVERESEPIRAGMTGIGDLQWMGLGGTITTLAAMDLRMVRYDRERVQGHELTAELVARWQRRLSAMTGAERRAVPGLAPERADIILAGAVILRIFMESFSLASIRVSDRDNLEGYLLMRMDREGRYPVQREGLT